MRTSHMHILCKYIYIYIYIHTHIYIYKICMHPCDMFVCLQYDCLFFNVAHRGMALQSLSKHSMWGISCLPPPQQAAKSKVNMTE